MTSKRIWECSILNEKRSALSKYCVRILLTVCHTQSAATRASHVTVSMLCTALMTVVLRAQCLRSVSVLTVTVSHVWAIRTPDSLLTLSLHDIWRCYLLLRGKKIELMRSTCCLSVCLCLLTDWLPVWLSVGPPFKFSKHWQIFTT